MRYRHPSLLITMLGLLLIVAASGAGAPAFGAPCGGVMPCSCGDTVEASRTLVCGVDPVTTTICPDDGLIIARVDPLVDPPVNLNLNFCTIRGDGGDVGILIADDEVTVRSGKITGFATGIATDTGTTGSTLHGMQVFGNGEGIDVTASETTISSSVVSHNEGDCLFVRNGPEDEDRNIVKAVRCEYNWGRGFVIRGTLNSITGNVAQANGEVGFDIGGNRATVSSNRSQDSQSGDGFSFDGSRHTVSLNYTLRNWEDGFHVSATDSRFDRNRSDYNGVSGLGFGILDTTIGGGTSMTANTYPPGNRCTGNTTDKSSPSGLCK